MEPALFIFLADTAYKLTRAKHCTDLLSPEALNLFTRFKTAYDGKDSKGLGQCFAAHFEGDFYGAESKDDLIAVFDDLFGQLPAFVSPYLTITIYGVEEHTETAFEAIVSFNTKCAIAGFEIPFADYATGKAICRIEPCGSGRNQWRITRLADEDESG